MRVTWLAHTASVPPTVHFSQSCSPPRFCATPRQHRLAAQRSRLTPRVRRLRTIQVSPAGLPPLLKPYPALHDPWASAGDVRISGGGADGPCGGTGGAAGLLGLRFGPSRIACTGQVQRYDHLLGTCLSVHVPPMCPFHTHTATQ